MSDERRKTSFPPALSSSTDNSAVREHDTQSPPAEPDVSMEDIATASDEHTTEDEDEDDDDSSFETDPEAERYDFAPSEMLPNSNTHALYEDSIHYDQDIKEVLEQEARELAHIAGGIATGYHTPPMSPAPVTNMTITNPTTVSLLRTLLASSPVLLFQYTEHQRRTQLLWLRRIPH